MDNTFTAFSPCKLNLFLHIIGQRSDGYHLLQSYFQLLDYGDLLSFTPLNHDAEIYLSGNLENLCDKNNLIYKAARLLQKTTDCTLGAEIAFQKEIPMGAGLGGGSSNAATTLLVLNKLWHLQLSLADLMKLGQSLGADVPFFLGGQSAFVEGVGEQIHPMDYPERYYLVLVPKEAISTQEIFSHSKLTRTSKPITIRAFQEQSAYVFGDDFRNDCQEIVRSLYPSVAESLDWLSQYAPARLTGTGSCVFAEFDKQAEASKIASLIPKHLSYFVSKGLSSLPAF